MNLQEIYDAFWTNIGKAMVNTHGGSIRLITTYQKEDGTTVPGFLSITKYGEAMIEPVVASDEFLVKNLDTTIPNPLYAVGEPVFSFKDLTETKQLNLCRVGSVVLRQGEHYIYARSGYTIFPTKRYLVPLPSFITYEKTTTEDENSLVHLVDLHISV